MPERKPIFYDKDRRRWRWTRRVLEITGALFHAGAGGVHAERGAQSGTARISAPGYSRGPALDSRSQRGRQVRRGRKRKVATLGTIPQNYEPLRAAFYVSDDYTSLASLQLHYRDIDLLIPEALHAVSADGRARCGAGSEAHVFSAMTAKRTRYSRFAGHVDGEQLRRRRKRLVPAGNAADAGQPVGSPASRRCNSSNTRMRNISPGSWWTSNRCRNRAKRIFRCSSTTWALRCTRRGLKLMVALPAADWSYDYKYFASQVGRHHPDELRFPLAHVGMPAPSRRRTGSCATSTT